MPRLEFLRAPSVPCPVWQHAFSVHVQRLVPSCCASKALNAAAQAHPYTWLLEPDEAADLWVRAVLHQTLCRSA